MIIVIKKGILIPNHFLAKAGLDNQSVLDIAIENGAIVLRKPFQSFRAGWREAAQQVNALDADIFLLEELENLQDEDWVW